MPVSRCQVKHYKNPEILIALLSGRAIIRLSANNKGRKFNGQENFHSKF